MSSSTMTMWSYVVCSFCFTVGNWHCVWLSIYIGRTGELSTGLQLLIGISPNIQEVSFTKEITRILFSFLPPYQTRKNEFLPHSLSLFSQFAHINTELYYSFGLLIKLQFWVSGTEASKTDYSSLTEEDWKTRLTPQQFYICRQKGTERAFTG